MIAPALVKDHVQRDVAQAAPVDAKVNAVEDALIHAEEIAKVGVPVCAHKDANRVAKIAVRIVAKKGVAWDALQHVRVDAKILAPVVVQAAVTEVVEEIALDHAKVHAELAALTLALALLSINAEIMHIDRAKSITFIVTKDCQLACKYCYLVGKNSKERMPFEVAKQAIDYILRNRDIFNEDAVTWDFIGGEPFLEIELIDKICDYIKKETFRLNHPWFNHYMFNFSTNGINYDSPLVQKYIKKNLAHLCIGITIDGTQRKHDLNRIYKNTGKGSYADVVKNIPLWLSEIPGGTKVTISSRALKRDCYDLYIQFFISSLMCAPLAYAKISCESPLKWLYKAPMTNE